MTRLMSTTIKISMFAVFCLPFSLMTCLSLYLPWSDLDTDPAMLTVLHLLCTAQFALNFIVYTILQVLHVLQILQVYTILQGPAGTTYTNIFNRVKLWWLLVLERDSNTDRSSPSLSLDVRRRQQSSVSSVSSLSPDVLSRQNSSSIFQVSSITLSDSLQTEESHL